MGKLPRLLFTLGDVAGVGPEVLVKAWPELTDLCRPVAVGDVQRIAAAVQMVGGDQRVVEVTDLKTWPATTGLLCLRGSAEDLHKVRLGQVSRQAGRAAYDFLCRAIDLVQAGQADGLVTLPLHKEGLKAAGLHYPGHTEILAERTGSGSLP